MGDKRDGLDALFDGHKRKAFDGEAGARRYALTIIEDNDGDLALVKMGLDEGENDVEVLGWMVSEEAAHEFSRLVNAIASGDAKVMSDERVKEERGTIEELTERFREGR